MLQLMVLKSLKITVKANELCYSDVLEPAVDALSRYSSKLYTKTDRTLKSSSQQKIHTPKFRLGSLPTTRKATHQVNDNTKQCVELFDKLLAGLQNEIRKKRLAHIEHEDDQLIS